jgi:nucleoside 2-deoxyribosyltransferase
MPTTSAQKNGPPIYCAGPMFSAADLAQQLQIADKLQAAFDPYLPQRDGIEVAKVMDKITTGINLPPGDVANIMDFARKIVFALDVFQVAERCRALVFNMDGRVPDEGSAVEAAIACATDKPVVIFKTTPVTILGGYDNPMVQGLTTNWKYVGDLDSLLVAVSSAVAARPHGRRRSFGQHMDAVIKLGRDVWAKIDLIHKAVDDTPDELLAQVRALEQLWSADLIAAYGSDGQAG